MPSDETTRSNVKIDRRLKIAKTLHQAAMRIIYYDEST